VLALAPLAGCDLFGPGDVASYDGDDAGLDAALRARYHADAVLLAADGLRTDSSALVVPPDALVERYYRALVAVRNAGFDRVRDLHAAHGPYVSGFDIHVDYGTPWLAALEMGAPTGVPALDSLRSTYGFTLALAVDTAHEPAQRSLWFRSDRALNPAPLARAVRPLPGVRMVREWAGSSGGSCVQDAIRGSAAGGAVTLAYAFTARDPQFMGWGCEFTHTTVWTYRVTPDVEVRYLGSRRED
jgi:hypothetical protein